MADNYQEALIKAIETISKSQVDSLATDKTVTATIASCSDLLTNEYKVSYNDKSHVLPYRIFSIPIFCIFSPIFS